VSSLRRDVSPKLTVPQTRRLSFAELDELFEAKISARKFKSTHAQLRRAEQAAGYV
jgi:hypothetical protein